LHLDVRRRQPSASGRDAGIGHLFEVPYLGTAQAQKAPPGAAWRFFACEAVGKSVSRRCQPSLIRISEKTPAPPGSRVFLVGHHGRLLTAGDRQSFPQKLVACKDTDSPSSISHHMHGRDRRPCLNRVAVLEEGESLQPSDGGPSGRECDGVGQQAFIPAGHGRGGL
jgi:hypothetical protein